VDRPALTVGDRVRLKDALGPVPAGSAGRIIGRYHGEVSTWLVSFGVGNVAHVRDELLERVEDEPAGGR
jgi:hypothetical protein